VAAETSRRNHTIKLANPNRQVRLKIIHAYLNILLPRISATKPTALVDAQKTDFSSQCVYDNDDSLIQFIFNSFTNETEESDGVKLLKRMKNSISKNCYNMYNRICKLIYSKTDDYITMLTAKKLIAAEKAASKKIHTNNNNGNKTVNTNPMQNAATSNMLIGLPLLSPPIISKHSNSSNNNNNNNNSDININSNSNSNNKSTSRGSMFLGDCNSPVSPSCPRISVENNCITFAGRNIDPQTARSVNSSDDEDDLVDLGPRLSVGVLGASLLGFLLFLDILQLFTRCFRCTAFYCIQ
jgi:hypothetical protein